MTDGGKVLALIPARGGSKGVPRKNIREVGGRPLIAYTVEAAKSARSVSAIVVSTEDDEIAAVAASLGVDVLRRPLALAGDDAPGIAPVLHALEQLPEFAYVVLLQPTSPLRTAQDIDNAVAICLNGAAPACVSVSEAEENPHWMFWLDGGKMRPVLEVTGGAYTRRQDLPTAYVLNGAVYVAARDWLLDRRSFLGVETAAYIMPLARALDIDTEADLDQFRRELEAH